MHGAYRRSRPGTGRPMAVSFELFPPKTEEMDVALWDAIERLAPLGPSFVSVTYGAGGSTRERTHATVARIVRETQIAPAAHLTCVAASTDEIDAVDPGALGDPDDPLRLRDRDRPRLPRRGLRLDLQRPDPTRALGPDRHHREPRVVQRVPGRRDRAAGPDREHHHQHHDPRRPTETGRNAADGPAGAGGTARCHVCDIPTKTPTVTPTR